jgi:assimilatory nitrate reductase catalytic subunit
LCSKGWTAATLLDHPQRLLTPLVRSVPGDRTSEFRAASWDEALTLVVSKITELQADHGPDGIGCFGGGGLTNEKAYAFGKFARVGLRTSMIDYNGRFCMSSAATSANRAFGVDRGLPFPLADIAEAKTILLVGSNPAATMPPAMQFFDAGRAAGATHIVVDPRRTATAHGSTRHLAPWPGTDLALANGLLHLLIKQDLVDRDYVAARTKGFPSVQASVAGYWPDRVERITGVPVAELYETVEALATAQTAMILTARGAEQHSSGTDTAQAFINLALALGLPGKPGSGYGTITGQGNGQGGREHGQKADQLPGYRRLADPADRAYVAGVWGIDPSELPKPGLSAFEMLDRMGTPGGVRGLLVLASNIAVSAPDMNRVIDRLGALDLLVVSDIFMSETAALADVVLPTAQWAEEEGTMTNLEGRVLRRRKALTPPGAARSELDVLADLARLLDSPGTFDTDPAVVFDELARASAGGKADYSGLSHARLDAHDEGLFWPCPSGSAGTPRMFTERFAHPGGRARMVATLPGGPADDLREDRPVYLVTGRVLAHYQSGAQTRRVTALNRASAESFVELHPQLARRLAVEDGDDVAVTSPRGTAVARARITTAIRPDTVFMPFHWPGAGMANAVTNDATDPISGMPEFKVCAVSVARADLAVVLPEEVPA